MGIRRTFEPLPVFEALFYMQMRLIPDCNVINHASVCEKLDIYKVMCIGYAKCTLDDRLHGVPMLAKLGEDGSITNWLVVGTDKGVVVVSEKGEIYWSDSYSVQVKKYFPNNQKKMDLAVKKALVCGLSIRRLLTYLEQDVKESDIELYRITNAIHGAADIQGNGDLNKVLGFP